MPLPIILGVAAGLASITGIGSGIHGASKMKEANDTMQSTQNQHRENIAKLEHMSETANTAMDSLGTLELNILKSFDDFSNTIEKIQNRPQFEEYKKDDVELPTYNKESLKNVSIGAGVLLGGLGGAAVGTAGGFAAAGATTSAVMALGTASTGTLISSLSGVAATNATLAALGGGAIAAGGGGMALGTTMLGATTLGVGLLVGGVVFNITGKKLSNKADEAKKEMETAKKTIDAACIYLMEVEGNAQKYCKALEKVKEKYSTCYNYVSYVVNNLNKINWNEFSEQEKIATQNTVLLVGLLYKMCQLNLVNKSENEGELNTVNKKGVVESILNSWKVLDSVA